jgi:uncharacterized protein (DUF2141 family)
MMKKLWAMSFYIFSLAVQAEVVTLKISNLGEESGQMAVAVFNNPDSFPDRSKDAILKKFAPLKGGESEAIITLDLKPGRYAVATFLDKNKNQNLDTNLVGAPKERFGFSNNPRINFSAPNFAECEFEVLPNKKQQLGIKLIKFF